MHIPDGMLPAGTLVAGAALGAAGVALGLRRLDADRLPQVAVLSSALFVASLIHVKVPGTSVHLVLSGLAGIILGWSAFPALLVALFLQAVFFGHGGLTALGVNTVNMALPAVICHYLFNRNLTRRSSAVAAARGFAAGALAVALSCLMVALTLATAGKGFVAVAWVVFVAHLPIMGIEGFVTASAVSLMHKVHPELLSASPPPEVLEEESHA